MSAVGPVAGCRRSGGTRRGTVVPEWVRMSSVAAGGVAGRSVVWSGGGVVRRSVASAGVVGHPRFADPQFVAVAPRGLVDAFAADVGAVQAAAVAQGEAGVGAQEFGVLAGDGDVVQEDVAAGVAAGGDAVLGEQ